MKIVNQTSSGGVVYKKEKGKFFWLVCQHSGHLGWVFPKGLVGDNKKNESMEEAALREVEEEGGVKAKIVDKNPIKTFYQYRFKDYLIKKTVYYYLMEYLFGDPKNHDWEMKDCRFLTQKQVLKTLTYSSDIEVFKKFLKKIENENSRKKTT